MEKVIFWRQKPWHLITVQSPTYCATAQPPSASTVCHATSLSTQPLALDKESQENHTVSLGMAPQAAIMAHRANEVSIGV
jgi:hypothetical protein